MISFKVTSWFLKQTPIYFLFALGQLLLMNENKRTSILNAKKPQCDTNSATVYCRKLSLTSKFNHVYICPNELNQQEIFFTSLPGFLLSLHEICWQLTFFRCLKLSLCFFLCATKKKFLLQKYHKNMQEITSRYTG